MTRDTFHSLTTKEEHIMTHKSPRILSVLLAAAMIVSMLAFPASAAARYYITADCNGAETYNESYPDGASVGTVILVKDLGVGVDAKVSVDGSSSGPATIRPISTTGKLENGTEYKIVENSDRSLSLTTIGSTLADNIHVTVETTPQQFSIEASSGPLGFKNNLGSDSNPTCNVSANHQYVEGNAGWSVTFTPNDTQLTIKSLNIRSAVNMQNIVPVSTGSLSVAGTDLIVTRSGDSVTVSTQHAGGNIYITALTEARSAQYTLNVNTSGDVSTSVASETLDAGSQKDIVLTAGSGSLVDSITITDGKATGSIGINDSSVSVNGHTYTVSRGLDGKVTLSVPAIKDNVTINVTASTNKAYLHIVAGSNVESNYPETTYFDIGSSYTVRLTPGEDAEITSIKIESATDSTTLDGSEYRFALDGRYYRVDTRYDTSRVIYFDFFPGNIEITVESKDSYHTLTLRADNHCDFEGIENKIRVYDGDSHAVSFYPDASYTIEELVFSYMGRTYRADRGDSYIRINSVRCPIVWDASGRVTVTLHEIGFDITIRANTEITEGSGEHLIALSTDGGATYSGTGRIYVESGGSSTVTFTEQSGYDITQLIITRGNRTYRILNGTNSVSINGYRCSATWSNNKVTLTLRGVNADMTVFADTDYDGRFEDDGDWYGGDYLVTVSTDVGSTANTVSRIGVSKGASKTIIFTPKSGYEVEEIVVTRSGKSYSAVRDEGYITVNNQRCSLIWSSNGKVSITLSNITADMAVQALTTSELSTGGTHTITRRPDSHSSITLDPNTTSVRPGRSVTVTVTPESGYYLESVELLLGNVPKMVSESTHSFNYGSRTYEVQHGVDGSISIYFADLPQNLTVSSVSKSSAVIRSDSYHPAFISGVGGGRFAPDAATTRAEALVMLSRAVYGAAADFNQGVALPPYADVPATAWYSSYIAFAHNQGLLTGLHGVNSLFRPDELITRAEYTELACRFLGVYPSSAESAIFIDVSAGHWATKTVSYAYSQGWVAGYPDGSFRPENAITRAEMVALTNRVLNRIPDRAYISGNAWALISFSDVPSASWAYYDIMEAVNSHFCASQPGNEFWAN